MKPVISDATKLPKQPSTDNDAKSATQKPNATLAVPALKAPEPNKRKLEEISKAEDDIPAPPSTPTRQLEKKISVGYEKTPGRDGPIRPEIFGPSPKIHPFKGPPGKRVRKTAYEREQEYKQHIRANKDHCFHELYVCFDKGPNGSPTYDKSGFQLDWHKVAHWMQPTVYNKQKMIRGMENAVNRAQDEKKRMVKIFFADGEAPVDDRWAEAWKDRVSKDLNIPFHKIGVEHFELWERKGFPKAKRADYENPSEEERKRFLRLISGASLRK